jgi:hypothetical protein
MKVTDQGFTVVIMAIILTAIIVITALSIKPQHALSLLRNSGSQGTSALLENMIRTGINCPKTISANDLTQCAANSNRNSITIYRWYGETVMISAAGTMINSQLVRVKCEAATPRLLLRVFVESQGKTAEVFPSKPLSCPLP